ncbi:hypothetical protein RhiirA5_424367 [Rhizophagus irregularis]|uniref:Kelch-like protein 17 n=1 Tax=Rhizophagus irregularis TaxID=588596 RepID=A0A2N0P876_9GLOM|nr:hypothetical protein RhiirA5_424367 [Rhizophagus irregularis]
MYDNKFLPKLSQNLLEVLEDNEFYDITIEVGHDPHVKIFRAHMVILNYRSSYLRRILSTNVNEKRDDGAMTHIKLPNILPEIFQMILRYIYGGRLSLEEYDTSDIIKILIASSELNLQELITHLQLFLIETKKDWMEQNFNLIYETNKLIKDFIIQPNNKPEPKTITKVISQKSIDSKIITLQHVELVSKWIDKLEITDKVKNLYEFKLILRGSRDGFSSSKFHEICDDQSHTISIIKVKDSNEILGGYNPLPWNSRGGYGITRDSFIFSFMNKENIENYVLSRVMVVSYATFNHINCGPSFGSDLVLCGENGYDWSCNSGAFYKSIRETKDYFSVEEYEIFQILKE